MVHRFDIADDIGLCFVARSIGRESEVWMWRQLVGFKRLTPHVLTWEYLNRNNFPLGAIPILTLPNEPNPYHGKPTTRWVYRLRCLFSRNFYSSVGGERRTIEKWLSETQPKVILCHFGFAALRLLPVAEHLGIPLVAHFHGLDLSSSLKNRWYRWSLLPALRRFSAMVVVGSHQRQWLLEHGVPPEQVHLIPCGAPAGEFAPRRKAARCGSNIRFVTVSRLVDTKGVQFSIQALALVADCLPQCRLVIIGDGPLRGELEELVSELGVRDNVSFKGALAPREVRDHLQDSEVFLQHSIVNSSGWVEGFGVSVCEAAACGLPVVATHCGGIADQVVDGETGFLVPMGDVKAMAERMLQLAREPELRAKMGVAGRARTVNEFESKKQIRELESLLISQCRRESTRKLPRSGGHHD